MASDKSLPTLLIRSGYFILIGLIIGGVCYSINIMFLPILISLLLTFLLQPLVLIFENRGFNRITILAGIYIVTTLIAVIMALLLVPVIVNEARHIADNIPLYQTMIRDILTNVQNFITDKFPSAQVPDLYELLHSFLIKSNVDTSDTFSKYASSAMSVLSMVVLIPVITFFFLADGHLIKKALLRLVPNRYFEMVILLGHKVSVAVQSFIRGQMIDALAVGVMTAIGCAIIGMPFFLVIGIVAGVGNLIPYLGPIIGFIPAFLVLLMSPEGLTGVGIIKIIVVFIMVQFIEGTFIYPIAVGKSVNMHPLTVIIGITVGGQVAGIVGMLFAIPLIAIAKVTVEVLHFYLKQYSIL